MAKGKPKRKPFGMNSSLADATQVMRQLPVSDIEAVFGKNAEKEEKGFLGCIHFFDAMLEKGGERPPQKRIHIDKFTGGVMYGGLFSETPAYGELTIRVDLEEKNKKAAGLLLMALRDVGLGILPLGSGSSIGRGYIDGSELLIKEGTEVIAKINLKSRQIEQGADLITKYVKAV